MQSSLSDTAPTTAAPDAQQQQQLWMQQQQQMMQHQAMLQQQMWMQQQHMGMMQQGGGGGNGGGGVPGGEENKTLWVGDLQYWMDESYLNSCFAHTNQVLNIKVIRNRQTNQSEGYGFVEFSSHAAAETILGYNGTTMPNTDQPFRLNWASFNSGEKRAENGQDHSVFVGDLSSDVTDVILQETFSSRFSSVKGAKVVIDALTGRSKGYGFVRFGDDNERQQALTEMNGAYCCNRPMRLNVATPRKPSGYQSQGVVLAGGYGASTQNFQTDDDANNTTLFVGGLDASITDEDLRMQFSQYGDIVSVKIPVGKGCGFVQFANKSNAENALQGLNGATIGNNMVRLSWGRSPVNKQQPRGDNGNQWNGGGPGGAYYGGSQGYGYAAAPVPQDPQMYAGAAYGNNQQQVS